MANLQTVLDDRVYTPRHRFESTNTKDIVKAWHNDTHEGAFRFCDEQPCSAINHAQLP